MWHCFGCQKGGDIFSFLMEYEHIEFPEALRILAKRAGVTLTGRGFDSETSSKKEAIYTVNQQAAKYYHYILTNLAAGKKALDYLLDRGVSEKVINSFQLGYAPNSRYALKDYLIKKKGHTKDALLEAGLVTQLERDSVDFFRDRIVFPLTDHLENIVGFSGRTMDTTGNVKAKYINTRETLVYHKGEMFFGLNMTKDAIRKADQVILVEGEFDLLSSFQNGIANVVGVKGTALTEKQVKLLSRYASKVTVCFDGDKAGQNAIKRSLPILEKYNLQTTVIVLPEGKDPDEAIKENLTAFKQSVKHDSNVYDFLLQSSLKQHDTGSAVGKGKIASELLPVFGEIGNEIVKEHYLKKLSTELDTTLESLQKEIGRLQKKEQDVIVPVAQLSKASREEMLEEYVLAIILQSDNPKQAFDTVWEVLSEALVPERAQQKVLVELQAFFATNTGFSSAAFTAVLPSELTQTVNKAVLTPLATLPLDQATKELMMTAKQLRDVYLRQRIKLLGDKLKGPADGAEEADPELQEQFARLVNLLKK